MNIEIANRLVQLRKSNNLSQEELAAKIGISRQAVSKWERAEASPDTDNLISLSKIYNVSLDDLLKSEDEEYEYVVEEQEGSNGARPEYFQPKPLEIEDVSQQQSNGYRAIDERKSCCPSRYDTVGENADAGGYLFRAKVGFSRKQLMRFPYPVFVTLIYFVLGSVLDLWHPAWVLFMTIPMYYPLVSCIAEDGTFSVNRRTLLRFPYPVFITMVYLLVGSVFDLWHPGWVLFLTIPLYYSTINGIGR